MSRGKFLVEIDYHSSAEDYFRRLKPLGGRVWLDSGRPFSDSGRFDILSAGPEQVLLDPSQQEIENAALFLNQQWRAVADGRADTLPFWGGVIGYFNYEHNSLEHGLKASDTRPRPSVFGLFHWALLQDHQRQKTYAVFLPTCNARREILAALCAKTPNHDKHFTVSNLAADLAREDYFHALDKIRQYIIEGDTYQINFAQRFSGDFAGDADAAYLMLRRHMPNPHCAYIELHEDIVLSFSPERFIKIHEGLALTQPIKGTAPRGLSAESDHRLASSLRASEKDRAENLMIVDLLRNDFSRSCEPFSVRVPELFTLESFANVHHLVSTVEGKIKPGVSPLTFFLRCFPGGSITGAPKKRAMEIIRELEHWPRNVYCGSICYWSANGRFDSSICIRTLLVSAGKIFCWGGGGIVADSEPEEEYRESLQKIQVLIEALKRHSI